MLENVYVRATLVAFICDGKLFLIINLDFVLFQS